MQRVPITSVTPGMVLAQSILRPDGMVLAVAGLVLTEEGIARIRTTGVVTVMVEGEAEGGGACVEFERVAAMLGYLFRNHKRDAFMMTLHNMLAGYFSRRIATCKDVAEAAKAQAASEKAAKAAEAAAAETAEAVGNAKKGQP